MQHKPSRGFTLLEVLITVSILGILSALAAPSFTNVLRNNRTSSVSNELVAALQLARSEAIRQRQTVRVCPVGQACTGTNVASTSYAVGWRVIQADGTVLREREATHASITVTGPVNGIAFDAMGRLLVPTTAFNEATQGTLQVRATGCGTNGGRNIRVERGGRVATVVVNC